MRNPFFVVAGGLCLLLTSCFLLTAVSGCKDTPPPDPAKLASMIKTGTSTAVALGMMAVPSDEEALAACKEALSAIDKNVLPILKGDEQGLINGLQKILTLEALNNPKLAKVKMVLEAALPILKSYIPSDLADNAVGKLSPEIKSYIIAFFEGARQGLADFVGIGERGSKYLDLKKKLAS